MPLNAPLMLLWCLETSFWCLETAFGSGFLLASGGCFRSRMRFFVRINWKYAVLTIASYASRKIFQPWLNIIPKRWEKVKFQAVQHLLTSIFEFWSASALWTILLVRSVLDQSTSWFHVWLSRIHGVVHAIEQVNFYLNIFCTTCERFLDPTGGLVFATAIRGPPHKRETAIWEFLVCLFARDVRG